MWSGIPEDITAATTALLPANLGYPPNPLLLRPAPCGADADVAHLVSLLPPATPVHVFAHSYGGFVALGLARALGDRLASLFIYEPVMFGALLGGDDAQADAETRALMANSLLMDPVTGGEDAWIGAFIDYWNRPGTWARLPPAQRAWTRAVGWKMFQEVQSVFGDSHSFAPFAIDIPCTLMRGGRSPYAARAMVDGLHKRNPQVRVVEASEAGHMGPLTHPGVVHEAMRAHMQIVRALRSR